MSDIVQELRDRADSYRLGGPSSEHTAVLLERAAIEIARLQADLRKTNTPAPLKKVRGPDGLDEQAFDAARVAFHRTAVGDYGTLRAAISAYLAAAPKPAAHALKLAEGRLSLLLEAYPDESDKIDHPTATRYVLAQVRAALATSTEVGE